MKIEINIPMPPQVEAAVRAYDEAAADVRKAEAALMACRRKAEDARRALEVESIKDRCPECGYTKEDCAMHLDHHLCRQFPFFDWEKEVRK